MDSRADVVAYVVHDGMVDGRHVGRRQSAEAVEGIDGRGIVGSKVFTSRIGPLVFLRTGYIKIARRNQSQQFVLVKRQFLFTSGIETEVRTKPMGETACNPSHALAKCPFGQRCASAS